MRNYTVLWLQSAGCGGCTMSLLCAENPGFVEMMETFGIQLLWHPTLSQETGEEVSEILNGIKGGEIKLNALCVEGAIPRGPRGTGRFHMLGGTGRSMLDWVRDLSPMAEDILAVGSCAAFGGVTAAGPNLTDSGGLQNDGTVLGGVLGSEFRAGSGRPVINIAGCPTHPNWVTETLMLLALGQMDVDDLDSLRRPRFYADHLVHHGCPRNEYYEYKASAENLADLGCMMENLGCIGTQAHGDCNTRTWNGEGSCTRGGYPCINCTAPEFEEPGRVFTETPKIAGVPIGLPTDMPKAWFIALSSLSKAATPQRLRDNAKSERIVVPPTVRGPKSS